MYSLILRIAAKQLLPVFLFFSLIILLRGHNAPGGGFIGGLIAAAGFILFAIAYSVEQARQKLKLDPRLFIGLGLFIAVVSGLPSFLKDQPFRTVEFGALKVPLIGKIAFSTPLIFDTGVFLVVIGVLLTIVFTLSEEQ